MSDMKTYQVPFIGCLLFCCSLLQAQTADRKIWVKSPYFKVDYTTETDEKSGGKTIVWPSTENWVNDTCWVENVPLLEDWQHLFPSIKSDMAKDETASRTTICYLLEEEENETVLHCFLVMPGDVVTNLWLAHEETAILDRATGIRYKARRVEPNCWGKHFGVRAKKGDILDFRIYFPPLPPTTRSISIYGVPNWYLRGGRQIRLHRSKKAESLTLGWFFDDIPEFHTPCQVKQEGQYDKNDGHSWSVFTDAHLIKPIRENTMALWLTPSATYLAIAKEQNWMREYYGIEPGTLLVDGNGRQFKLRKAMGLPLGHTFWMEGFSGDFIAFLLEFDPLPIETTNITYYEPEGEPFDSWGANWKGNVFPSLDVQTLRENQRFFDYFPRQAVE